MGRRGASHELTALLRPLVLLPKPCITGHVAGQSNAHLSWVSSRRMFSAFSAALVSVSQGFPWKRHRWESAWFSVEFWFIIFLFIFWPGKQDVYGGY